MKVIRLVNAGRLPEDQFKIDEVVKLVDLCRNATLDQIKTFIDYFNNSPEKLSTVELCFLANYVLKGIERNTKEMDYSLYLREDGQREILSEQEVADKGYEVINPEVKEKVPTKNPKLQQLENEGFKILRCDLEIIAFNKDKNITFFVKNPNNFSLNDGSFHFQQPYVTSDGETALCFRQSIDKCKDEKIDYPTFNEDTYPFLYNAELDEEDTPYIASMKKIAQLPDLYDAIGPENQRLVDFIVEEYKTSTSK